ncbi:tripartite tricarboxylate transporter substrate binding protein [Bordetella petrii]|uniref:tripartite tricarboxylate transporter substrate binding protein n=1 Tax=Bordetella petrii TaxID=94624 RepID=UPI001E585144|nr:tripartite tricarboxylate transporter substrate binding protein [Bordetella petrii]MCD0502281.1 tripartite tricarboxylate transporter substrate binding protein [Bordetella petrii]
MLFTALLLSAVLNGPASAATYPDRPVRLIAPIAVGGLTDTLARLVAAGLADSLGQPVVVENKPGAGGIIGMEAAAKAAPDGYSLILVYQGVAAVNASLYPKLPYDTLRDFTPIAGLGSFPLVLVTHPGSGIHSVNNLLRQARNDPDALSYASAGNATTSHLTMELFKNDAGIQAMHVPYKGEGPANTDVAGGQVDIAFSSLASVAPLIKSGRLVALGIATRERSPMLPGVPTISEAGLSGFEAAGWYALLAPAGTPSEVVQTLSRAVAGVLGRPETSAKLEALGVTAKATPPAELDRQIRSETEKWKAVIQQSHITLN